MAEADPFSCPFCGKYGQEALHLQSGFHVACHPCGALGPVGTDWDDATAKWNRLSLAARMTQDGWHGPTGEPFECLESSAGDAERGGESPAVAAEPAALVEATGAVSEDAIKHLENRSPLNRAIYAAVRSYRMGNMTDADDPWCAYPLVDLMSNPAPADIGTGEMEMVALVDEIEAAILATASDRASQGEGAGDDFLAQLRRVNTERYDAWAVGGDAGIMFDALELGGEVGELLNVVKKLEREERGWRGSRAAPEDFADECADVLICLDKLARRRGVDLAAATIAKFNATSDKVGLPHKLALATPPSNVVPEEGEG